MQCFMCLAIVSVLWVVYGYSLAFGQGQGFLAPYIGGLDWFMLKGVDINTANADYAATIPHQAYMIFQMHVRGHHPGLGHRFFCRTG